MIWNKIQNTKYIGEVFFVVAQCEGWGHPGEQWFMARGFAFIYLFCHSRKKNIFLLSVKQRKKVSLTFSNVTWCRTDFFRRLRTGVSYHIIRWMCRTLQHAYGSLRSLTNRIFHPSYQRQLLWFLSICCHSCWFLFYCCLIVGKHHE